MRLIHPVIFVLLIFSACKEQCATPTAQNTQNTSAIEVNTTTTSDNNEMDHLNKQNIIIDSQMTLEEAIAGTTAPSTITNQLVLLDVEYYSDDNLLHRGQLVVNQSVEKDIREIFELIKELKFPVHQAIPIVAYDWDDNRSMLANNTSAFCYRKVAGASQLSRHATGKAIDINPFINPLVWKNEYIGRSNIPANAVYDINQPGTFHLQHPIVQEFKKRKFTWGYSFKKYYDYHHFHRN